MILRPVAPPVEYGITKRLARAGNAAIAFLRSLGTSAHVWLPGANGVSVASLPSNNYLLSDGSTGYSTVDGVVGLDLDAMGALGSELVTNGTNLVSTTGWTATALSGAPASLSVSGGSLVVTNTGTTYGVAAQTVPVTSGLTYQVTALLTKGTANAVNIRVGSTALGYEYADQQAATGGTVPITCVFKATSGSVFISLLNSNTTDGTGAYNNISVREIPGIHATQPTTANKPLVRRGAYNLMKQSEALGTAPWSTDNVTITDAQAANAGGQLTLCKVLANASVGANILQSFTSPSTALTMRFLCRMGNIATRGNRFSLYNVSTASELARFTINYSTGAIAHSIGSGATATDLGGGLWEVKLTQTTGIIAGHAIYVYGGYIGNTATAGDFAYIGEYHVEAGTSFTTYTPTTTTAASNPSAGKYWWSFDGSNDSLLSGNLAITTACTIVMSLRVNSLAATQIVFAEDTNGVQVSIATDGSVSLTKVGGAALVTTAAGVVVAGVPLVLTARLSAGTADIRKNGAQSATAASALTFSATTGARLGTAFNGTTRPTGGALGWVVPVPVALSDADCLTVERLVGQQFPGMATF